MKNIFFSIIFHITHKVFYINQYPSYLAHYALAENCIMFAVKTNNFEACVSQTIFLINNFIENFHIFLRNFIESTNLKNKWVQRPLLQKEIVFQYTMVLAQSFSQIWSS